MFPLSLVLRLLRLSLAGLLLATAGGCSQQPSRIEVPSMDPVAAGVEALATYDSNGDGAIADKELDRCPGLKQSLRRIDANKDGRLDSDEIAARIRKYQSDRIGVLKLIGTVTLDGKPLTGATVTLVPEKFMGPKVEPARSTTGPGGVFVPVAEGVDVPGARAGVYRVEISVVDADGKETLPAKYNSETTLGVELGTDNKILLEGIEFSLSSR